MSLEHVEVTATESLPVFLYDMDTDERIHTQALGELDDDFVPELELLVDDEPAVTWEESDYHGVGSRDVLNKTTIGDLNAALQIMHARRSLGSRIYIAEGAGDIPEEAREHSKDVRLTSRGDLLIAQASAALSTSANISHKAMLKLVGPLVKDHGLTIYSLGQSYYVDEDEGGDVSFWEVDSTPEEFKPHPHMGEPNHTDFDESFRHVWVTGPESMSVKKFLDVANDIALLMGALSGGKPTAEGVYHLVKNNLTGSLLRFPESSWYEVKRELYHFSNPSAPERTKTAQKIEFAQDVASFANGGKDAVIVIGIGEQLDGLHKLTPQKVPPQFKKSAFDVLDNRVYPPLDGVKIALSGSGEKQFVAIYIPTQNESKMPFLVKGVVVADVTESTFFSVPRRRGETKISLSAEEFHAQLLAGRAFLNYQAANPALVVGKPSSGSED